VKYLIAKKDGGEMREKSKSSIYQKSLAPLFLEKSEPKVAVAEINLLSGIITLSLINIYLISFLFHSTLNITIFMT